MTGAASIGLSAYELSGLTAVASSMLADVDTATSVVFTTATGARAYDPRAGAATYGETDTTVSAWVSDLTLEQVGKIDGAQVGDCQILVRYADLTTAPDTGDRCRVGSIPYRVYRVVRGPVSTHFVIYAQRVQ